MSSMKHENIVLPMYPGMQFHLVFLYKFSTSELETGIISPSSQTGCCISGKHIEKHHIISTIYIQLFFSFQTWIITILCLGWFFFLLLKENIFVFLSLLFYLISHIRFYTYIISLTKVISSLIYLIICPCRFLIPVMQNCHPFFELFVCSCISTSLLRIVFLILI